MCNLEALHRNNSLSENSATTKPFKFRISTGFQSTIKKWFRLFFSTVEKTSHAVNEIVILLLLQIFMIHLLNCVFLNSEAFKPE